jgi:hypothetical protein
MDRYTLARINNSPLELPTEVDAHLGHPSVSMKDYEKISIKADKCITIAKKRLPTGTDKELQELATSYMFKNDDEINVLYLWATRNNDILNQHL